MFSVPFSRVSELQKQTTETCRHRLRTLKRAPPLFFLPPISPPFPPLLICPSCLCCSLSLSLFLGLCLCVLHGAYRSRGVANVAVITCPDGPVWPLHAYTRNWLPEWDTVLEWVRRPKYFGRQGNMQTDTLEFSSQEAGLIPSHILQFMRKDWICRGVIF